MCAVAPRRQRTKHSCGVASLGIFLADLAVRRIDPHMRGLNTLHNAELLAAADTVGVKLRAVRRFNLDHDEGILRIRWNARNPWARESPNGHFVAVLAGTIECPAQQVALPWRDYLVQFDARACSLLKFMSSRTK
jgi:hypothetical protein